MRDFRLYGLGLSFLILSCGSVKMPKSEGYFITDFNYKNIEYDCNSKRKKVDENGKFECNSFPISFYIDKMKIGEIMSIHEDGYVYLQDIVVLEATTPIYSSEHSSNFLSIE